MFAGGDVQPFDPDRGRHDRAAHRHRLEGFDAGATADAERDHRNIGVRDIGADVIDKASETAVQPACCFDERRGRIAADNHRFGIGADGADVWPNLAQQKLHSVDISRGIHHTRKNDAAALRFDRRLALGLVKGEEFEIDTGIDRIHRRQGVALLKRFGVTRGDRDDAAHRSKGSALKPCHFAGLIPPDIAHHASGGAGVPLINLGFDIMGE